MALYHEAATILDSQNEDGQSLKTAVFSSQQWKSPPKALYALTTEAAKWSLVLSEVIDNSGLLKLEKHVNTLSNPSCLTTCTLPPLDFR